MSDDLIKRAREAAEPWDYGEPDTLITELVDRIEAQAAEIERLRLECQAQYDRGYYDGRQYDGAEEREKIVAWLLNIGPEVNMTQYDVADAVEEKEHLK
jgi:hypothetical protein